ncbi:plasma membrane H+-ATPase, pumps protons out of the cell [Syncephalis pseudoplumigaleata]|uniref:Plasma membrane ATPase n=1 Tax=Syncephalis pseudoplumigaleata TaxID=1712513 RepID=A0A4P9Z3V4_9FUNG|nr:plasma membrane H+-ATPase, pumps protons out of the cell [Syncephalis pseudoplumigaleata]|eukprot:RKP27234.1 plasma membrane H+-ATPase, pumps protons out of the cell [Syncephalis pseudoplumigaleata]
MTGIPASMLDTNPAVGLTTDEARIRRKKYGRNELTEEKTSHFKQFMQAFYGPIQYMIELAAILAAGLQDWIELGLICALLLINAVVGFVQEYQAGSTIAELQKTLALHSTVIRNGERKTIESKLLVPGDIICMEEGDIVPADAKLVGDPDTYIQVDQSVITGESLAARKHLGDAVYSSSTVKHGSALAVVTATGDHTFVGHSAQLVRGSQTEGNFQRIIKRIGYFLIELNVLALFITLINVFYRGIDIVQYLRFVLVITVSAVPIALPAVTTTTMAVGAQMLAKKKAIVSRLTAIEALAGVDVLCSDKTGTLTKNKLTVHDPYIVPDSSLEEIMGAASLASVRKRKGADAIDTAIIKATRRQCPEEWHRVLCCHVRVFFPFNPVDKRVETRVRDPDGNTLLCAKGAPQAIRKLVEENIGGPLPDPQGRFYEDAIIEFASRGYRSLGVASKRNDDPWRILGIISLYDPPRHDTKETIRKARELGLRIKMLTGDQVAIAKDLALELNLGDRIYDSKRLGLGTITEGLEGSTLNDFVEEADGFGQVYPEHKHQVVDILQRRNHLVAMTGDGVNDAPSLKKADVGIAVEGATDAARSASDIVFLAPGLSAIIDALILSRRIFHRMHGYCQYRIALSIHLLIYLTLSIVIFNYSIGATLVVFLAIFSDIAVLTIAYDRAPYARDPVKWNIGKLMFISVILAVILAIGTFLMHTGNLAADRDYKPRVFLEIALTQSWLIFSTRTQGWFFVYYPSWQLLLAVFLVDIFASIMAIFGWFQSSINVVEAIRVWFFSFGVFVVCDVVHRVLSETSFIDYLMHDMWRKPVPRAQEDWQYLLTKTAELHALADALDETRKHSKVAAAAPATVESKAEKGPSAGAESGQPQGDVTKQPRRRRAGKAKATSP